MKDVEEIAKIEGYLDRITTAVEGADFYPRVMHRYPFDSIASAMMSKSVALARSCLILIKAGQADEAYGLSRSVVECALILRYITSDPALQHERATKFAMFSFDYKEAWLHQARLQFAGTPEEADIERYAREWKLTGDPRRAKKHWSQLRGFTWDAQTLVHPLDGPGFDAGFKEKQYAVDYFQTCQWVHCSQPALDNYVPDEGRPFRIRRSTGEFGNPGHSVLYILLNYVHSVLCYAFYGLGIDRPKDLGPAFQTALAALTPVGTPGVFTA